MWCAGKAEREAYELISLEDLDEDLECWGGLVPNSRLLLDPLSSSNRAEGA